MIKIVLHDGYVRNLKQGKAFLSMRVNDEVKKYID